MIIKRDIIKLTMQIFYSPAFGSFTFVNLEKPLFNQKIVNTLGLIDTLELYAGICFERKPDEQRLTEYYSAMKKYFTEVHDSVLIKSFDLDALNTARECLLWRDSLVALGWDKAASVPSRRIKALADIEKYFDSPSFGEEILFVIQKIKDGCSLPDILPDKSSNIKITVPFDRDCFAPLEIKLLEALEKRGATVDVFNSSANTDNDLAKVYKLLASDSSEPVELANDGSFEILHFENQDEAFRYLSLLPEDTADVWINSNSRLFDNYLRLEGKPVSGSQIEPGLLQTGQILITGLGSLLRPLKLSAIVEWLCVPMSPLDYSLRKQLAEKIIYRGGYYNEECRHIIAKVEDEEIKKQIKAFLPDIDVQPGGTEIEIDKIVLFVNNLMAWCNKIIFASNDEKTASVLSNVKSQCHTLLAVLGAYEQPVIDSSQLEILIAGLNKTMSVQQYDAEKGCRCMITDAGAMCGFAQKTIWCDFYNNDETPLSTGFLFANEKEVLSKSPLWYEENLERKCIKLAHLVPFANTKEKLSLVVVDKTGSQTVVKNSLYIRLNKQIKNLADITKNPETDKKYFDKPKLTDNGMSEGEEFLRIKNAEHIKFPQYQSPTGLEKLIYNPFDYVFELSGIRGKGIDSAPAIWTSEGTVAHAVIEKTFMSSKEQSFDDIFDYCVASNGAVLLQDENKMECGLFKSKLRDCVTALKDVIETNNLHVVECEKQLQSECMDFEGSILIKGYADCILADKSGNLIVWDFKWSGNTKNYKKLLEENRSIQTTLYKELIFRMENKKAVSAAYILLPEVLIISTDAYKGNLLQVHVDDDERKTDLLEEIRNSYKYRKNQITKGLIEEGEGLTAESLTYANDTKKEKLVPLKFTDEGLKEANAYSNYGLFKEKRQ